ncbi:AMP-binding protein [Pseudonocardia saturnea]
MQGEPLDGDTFGWATDTLGVPVVNAYGQTETGSTWTYPVYGAEDLKAGSVGTPVPGHSFAILDNDGVPVAAGVTGLLRDAVVHGEPTGDTSAMDDLAALDAVAKVVRA